MVADEGPGFATGYAAQRGTSGAGSTGLGLDIARRIAEASGGSLTMGRSPRGGAAVTLALGPTAQPRASEHRKHAASRLLHGKARPVDARLTGGAQSQHTKVE